MHDMKSLLKANRHLALLGALTICLPGCAPYNRQEAAVQITRVPPANPGGPQKLDYIEGTVHGGYAGQQIILYAHSGIWWVQPFADQSSTKVLPDGTWRNSTHLGTEYAAILTESNYRPQSRVASLPQVGNGVIAIAVAKGTPVAPVVQKTLHFSGYDWNVRAAGSDRGGEPNDYDPENAWVDGHGFLHLRIGYHDGKWACAEVNLTHSLGYGTYRFVVQDTSHLGPFAVLGFFTWDELRSEDFRNELDIELSRWGDPKGKNAQYVVQPFYVPENISRFTTPPGIVTHSFQWHPGTVSFSSFRGALPGSRQTSVGHHVFTTGIPNPASEAVHISMYDFHRSKNPAPQPSEVVIEKFEYLP